MFRGVEVNHHTFLNSVLDGVNVSFTLRPFYHLLTSPWYPLDRRLFLFLRRFGRGGDENVLCLYRDSVQPLASRTCKYETNGCSEVRRPTHVLGYFEVMGFTLLCGCNVNNIRYYHGMEPTSLEKWFLILFRQSRSFLLVIPGFCAQ
jgi:hypothetical protein